MTDTNESEADEKRSSPRAGRQGGAGEANCAHLHVSYNPEEVDSRTGLMSERWTCDTSGCEFIPLSRVAAQAAELKQLSKDNGALREERCAHGWRGSVPEDGPRIVTTCPTCGLRSLFIGKGGHLTCASLECAEPGVGRATKALRTRAEKAEARIATLEGMMRGIVIELVEGEIDYSGAMDRIDAARPTDSESGEGDGGTDDMLEMAWVVIANAYGWDQSSVGFNAEWKAAAERWRDTWFASRPSCPDGLGPFPATPAPESDAPIRPGCHSLCSPERGTHVGGCPNKLAPESDADSETHHERDARLRHTPGTLLAYAMDESDADSGGDDGPTAEQASHMRSWGGERGDA